MYFASFYYPGYYDCPHRRRAAGGFVDEWRLVREAPSSVFVPTTPAVPGLGYSDCSQAAVLEEEALLAASHGIDAFFFNLYFDGFVTELERPLEVFSGLQPRITFGINVCCRMPRRSLPFGPHDAIEPVLQLTHAQFARLAEFICDKLDCPHYARYDGRSVVTMYHVSALLSAYGLDGLRERVAILKATSATRGRELLVVGLFSALNAWRELFPLCAQLPFDAYSSYIALPDFESTEPVQQFETAAAKWLGLWSQGKHCGKPVYPCVGAGWNATARGAAGYSPQLHGLCFPYHPVIVGDTADAFERYLRQAASLALLSGGDTAWLFLGPWNEWSEGAYLLPDTRHGDAKLQAVSRVKAMTKNITQR